jgi:hypothetical protein
MENLISEIQSREAALLAEIEALKSELPNREELLAGLQELFGLVGQTNKEVSLFQQNGHFEEAAQTFESLLSDLEGMVR